MEPHNTQQNPAHQSHHASTSPEITPPPPQPGHPSGVHIQLSPPKTSPETSPERPNASTSPVITLHDSPSPQSDHQDGGGHIQLSPPANSPERRHASTSPIITFPDSPPPRSDHHRSGGGHIHLSSPENSPPRSSLSSNQTSPENQDSHRNVNEGPFQAINRAVSGQSLAVVVAKSDPAETPAAEHGGGGGGSGRRKPRPAPSLSILGRAKREQTVKRAGLGFRVFGFLFCLVSFSVMAADQNQGWALDSFHRYIEFRYCMSINVIGFMYSAAQAFDLSYNLATGKSVVVLQQQQLRFYLDFVLDQIVTYLLISASSSAATRIDDWESNWGKDKFPDMATASVAMSFLAFAALAASSLISGYSLCTSRTM